jgi:putative endonuclease
MNRYKYKEECKFWDCDVLVSKKGHLLCLEHYYDDQDGFLRNCNSCQSYIDDAYDVCLDCKKKPKKPIYKSPKKYQKETNPAWDKADKEIKTFFVYILRLNDGSYYAGQTNNLRRRMYQHKERNTTKSTKDKNGKLMWFAPMPTRDSASQSEVELKKLIDKNPSAIDEKIIAFRDLIKEVDIE